MTPTQSCVMMAHDVSDVVDSNGRTLTIRRPTTLDRLHLFKAVGPMLAANERYLGLAMLAFSVTAIDGIPLPRPTCETQIDTAVERLGDLGIQAVADTLRPEDTEGLAVANAGN